VCASGGHAAQQFAYFVHAYLVGFPVFALDVGFFAIFAQHQVNAVVGAFGGFEYEVAFCSEQLAYPGFELAPGEAADVGYGICGFEAFGACELGEEGNECTQQKQSWNYPTKESCDSHYDLPGNTVWWVVLQELENAKGYGCG